MSKNIIFSFILFILVIKINILSNKYPIFAEITQTKSGNIKSILIKTKEQYINYILEHNFVITLTEYSIYEKEANIISVFDKLSSYKKLKDWTFLKIQCYEQNNLCDLLSKNITNKLKPLIKIYVKSQEIKISDIILNFNISELAEFLLKLSSNPIIEIKNNNMNEFFEKYGKFSPLIYYDEKNSEFISCINLLAKKKYFKNYFFGIKSINKTNEDKQKEKILFNNDNMPISLTWEGDCDDVDYFLSKNKYPLISRVDNELINDLIVEPQILVILIGYSSANENIIKFINNEFKKLAYIYKDFVFGFDFYNEFSDNNYIKHKTKFIFISKDINGMKLLLYNFVDELYYIHPIVYKLNSTNSDMIYNRLDNIISNYQNLPFTCGSFYKDIMRRFGFYKFISDRKKMTALGFTILIIIFGLIYLCIFDLCKY